MPGIRDAFRLQQTPSGERFLLLLLLFIPSLDIAAGRYAALRSFNGGEDAYDYLLPNNGLNTLPSSRSDGSIFQICSRPENNGRQITDQDFRNKFIRCWRKNSVSLRCKNDGFFFEFFERCLTLPKTKPFDSEKIRDAVDDGRKYANPCRQCPFDFDKDVCSDGDGGGGNGGDDGGSSTKPPGGGDGGGHPGNSTTTTTTTTTTENPIYQCPQGVNREVNIPHPCGCRKYQVCSKDGKTKRIAFCKEGRHYDIEHRTCDTPERAKCPNAGHACDDDEDSKAYQLVLAKVGDNDRKCDPNMDYNFQFQNKYYDVYGSCRGGKAFTMFCPDYYFYEETIEFCIPFPSEDDDIADGDDLFDDGDTYANPCRYCNPLQYKTPQRNRRSVSNAALSASPTIEKNEGFSSSTSPPNNKHGYTEEETRKNDSGFSIFSPTFGSTLKRRLLSLTRFFTGDEDDDVAPESPPYAVYAISRKEIRAPFSQ